MAPPSPGAVKMPSRLPALRARLSPRHGHDLRRHHRWRRLGRRGAGRAALGRFGPPGAPARGGARLPHDRVHAQRSPRQHVDLGGAPRLGFQGRRDERPRDRISARQGRGRLLGGERPIALRGVPADYDGWASLGNPEWAWSRVLPYFCKGSLDARGVGTPSTGRRPPRLRRRRCLRPAGGWSPADGQRCRPRTPPSDSLASR